MKIDLQTRGTNLELLLQEAAEILPDIRTSLSHFGDLLSQPVDNLFARASASLLYASIINPAPTMPVTVTRDIPVSTLVEPLWAGEYEVNGKLVWLYHYQTDENDEADNKDIYKVLIYLDTDEQPDKDLPNWAASRGWEVVYYPE